MNALFLSNENEKAIKDFMKQVKPNHEFEIRFGTFIYNKDTKKNNFKSECEIDFFYNLKKSFDNAAYASKKLTNTTEYIYNNNIKKIIDNTTNQTSIMKKTNIMKYDIYDYNFRLSLANENFADDLDDIDPNSHIMTREKQRTSYTFGMCQVDLTIVNVNNHTTAYEIELEVLSTFTEQNYEFLKSIITVILQTRQQNFHVISNYQKRQILNEYRAIVDSYYFVGAQPETLQKNAISNLYKERYSVTDKADGDRMLLFISKNHHVYFIDNNLQKIYKTNLKSARYSSTIVDGELVNINSKIHYLGFDLMAFNGTDIRGNSAYLLESRLQIMNEVILSIQNTEELYCIRAKKFYFKNVFLGAERILDTVKEQPYENDGLIFTPMDEPYPTTKKWSKLLKWKPAELNTIDFYSVKKENDEWELYVQQHVKRTHETDPTASNLVLFDVAKLCKNPVAVDTLMFKTSFDATCIDPSTNEPYKSNTVIEYKWDKNLSKFVPLRTRWDKTANPKKHGNFCMVACDIWNNIHNPVEKEHLLKFTVLWSAKEDYVFERMRKFHNRVKEHLYNTYCNNTDTLLELCSGRGGDMHKWIYNNIKNVVGYDISEKSIEECMRRCSQIKNSQTNINVYHQDLCDRDAFRVILQNNANKFDNVCCQFGVHYFFRSEETFDSLIQILDNSLKSDGHFIVTFMDNIQLGKLMKESTELSKEVNGEIVYYMKKNDNKTVEFGNRLKISLSGNNILSEGSDEYIINYEMFVENMKQRGYDVVDSELFQNIQGFDNLTTVEKDISILNRYCVFKKSYQQESILPIQLKQNVIENVSFDFESIKLHKEITVSKISTSYDILDILNCIEYKYYKNKYDSNQINSFEDILKTFEQYKIDYNPEYILNPTDFENYKESTNNIYFCYHKHVVEKSDTQEVTEYDNWYIIMYNNHLIFDKPNVEKSNNEKSKILEILSKTKVTIKLLKEYLCMFDLKTTGNKQELHERLVAFLNK
jgi:hypothetical protein